MFWYICFNFYFWIHYYITALLKVSLSVIILIKEKQIVSRGIAIISQASNLVISGLMKLLSAINISFLVTIQVWNYNESCGLKCITWRSFHVESTISQLRQNQSKSQLVNVLAYGHNYVPALWCAKVPIISHILRATKTVLGRNHMVAAVYNCQM